MLAAPAVLYCRSGDKAQKVAESLAAEGVLLLHGTEISTLYGDFVVFSPDLDYLAGFRALQDLPPKRVTRDSHRRSTPKMDLESGLAATTRRTRRLRASCCSR